ncbi:MAG: DUF2911 domain-containing protein [bacterium]|nr:DUF2911 domain-containing protein [bacterium]
MKKLMLALLMVLLFVGTMLLPGQQTNVNLPQASQKASISQQIGLTGITITYHSPAVKKRPVYGKLVPWDKVWRAGANENTTISFTTDVTVEGQKLAKGTYGLHAIPGQEEWTLVFSKNHTSWGSYFYKEDEDALRVKVKAKEAPHREWLAFDFTGREKDSVVASLNWEKLSVPFKIGVDLEATVIANLKNQLRSLPWYYWQGTYNAAKYCHDNDFNLEEALTWADRSVTTKELFNNVHLKSQLLAKLGKTEESKKVMAHADKIATEQDLTNYAYSLALTDKDKCLEILASNIKRFNTWRSHNNIAAYYNYFKQKDKAIKHITLAIKKAPADQKKKLEDALKKLNS